MTRNPHSNARIGHPMQCWTPHAIPRRIGYLMDGWIPHGSKKLDLTEAVLLPKINPYIPALPGAVVKQFKTCGRSGCRCARGELHGPYFYRVWREKGKQKKQYVKAVDVEEVRASCREWKLRHRYNEPLRRLARRKMERLTRRYKREAGAVPLPSFMDTPLDPGRKRRNRLSPEFRFLRASGWRFSST